MSLLDILGIGGFGCTLLTTFGNCSGAESECERLTGEERLESIEG
jgi:hypothetical protein